MNENKYEFKIINEEGKEIVCRALTTFESDGKNYIIYTDDTTNEVGDLNVYANKYDPNKQEQRFEPITDPAEHDLITKVIEAMNEGVVNE